MTDAFEPEQLVNGRYRIIEKLGSGGMAEVFLAEDTTLGRRVALKVLLRRFADDQNFVERFRREAKSAAGLNHPNVVGVYDWCQVDSLYYIVMEYVEGETLKDLIGRRGRLPGNEAVGIALGLLAAIDFAHQHHIVHRDIKSQNILIDPSGVVKVTDFGIARAGDSSMTEVGSILGTAQYLAPEQARGEHVDERTDLYSVGIVVYEMRTGQVPFKGDSAVTVAFKHVNELPPEPADLVPGLPHALNQIVLKALAKSPNRRYASATEFARDLRGAQSGGPLLAETFDSASERTQVMGALATAGEGVTQVLRAGERDSLRGESQRDDKRAGKRHWGRWVIVVIVLLLLAAAGVAFALDMFSSGSTSLKPVPAVVGLSQAMAVSQLKSADFKVGLHKGYSDTVIVGYVVKQDPGGATKLADGGKVDIWICNGAVTTTLIDFNLSGYTRADVVAYLNKYGLLGKAVEIASSDVPVGEIVKQSPVKGTKVKRGSTVIYYVSTGLPQVTVPDLSLLTVAKAEVAIQDAGLNFAQPSYRSSTTVLEGEVISQLPQAGEMADVGSLVYIFVSSGSPSPSPTPTPTPSDSLSPM